MGADIEILDAADTIGVEEPKQIKLANVGEGEPKMKEELKHLGSLNRRLKSRHVQFLALSGAIGTGLFVGSGQVLSLAGPLSAFISYAVTGFNLFCVINCLGEMAAWLPIPGCVPIFATRYVDALGFTLGWNYWNQVAIGVPVEVSVCCVVVDYWKNTIPSAALITIFFAAMVVVNCLPVHVYGEVEFAFGAVKLTTIVGLILLMLIITGGTGPDGEAIGFQFWNNPGAMNTLFGSETVVVASGETDDPRRNIPKVDDDKLIDAIDSDAPGANQSPFVVAIANSGIEILPGIINGVVLTSAWSAGNSFFYTSTRVLYAAALDDKEPSFLRFERFGVPYGCVALTTARGCLSYLDANNRSSDVFFWISNLSAVSTLIVWASVCYTYLCFYQELKFHGIDRDNIPAKTIIPPYIDIPIVTVLFCDYKLVKKTKFVKVICTGDGPLVREG
ncbi:hypothetical protein GMORB2_3670 [Geosmithia morbida]|uniref:Amino acid permease/ SLC12A domain-containing protein n=1 Tax=Geosmithia morbida TaxID=1094350 RepID=A0A9P5D5R5_9HYPO|nr:uncharacterized protein GMORB2_3670 [Geosmithia morbida]KAF4124831.1 hypothetical protein GMORB2_3670 [Geosmithia morbida]